MAGCRLSRVVHRLLPPEIIEERKQKSKPVTSVLHKPRHEDLKYTGLDDILVKFARCCHPLPGESIVGYITRGRGVTVHTTDCLSVESSNTIQSGGWRWSGMCSKRRHTRRVSPW